MKADWLQKTKIAENQAAKNASIRDAEMEKVLETKKAEAMLEKLRAEMLAKAKVDYEASMQASNAELYQKQQQAEAQLYTQRTNAQAVEQAADAQLYKKRKEAQGILATGEAQATYMKSMLEAFGGNYNALHDYLMLDRGVYQQLGEINAGAIKGLQPKISVWTTGPSTDAAATGAAGAPIADLFKMLPPFYTTIKDQTGITPLPFLATLPQEQK
jgi:flotillin